MKKAISFVTLIIIFIFQFADLSNIDCINAYDVSETENAINGIIRYVGQKNGSSGGLLNGGLSGKAGTPEGDWYAIALSRYGAADGCDRYLEELRRYTESSYQNENGFSAVKATEWHRIIMAVLSCGGDPYSFEAGKSGTLNLVSDGIYNRDNKASLGKQGITGWIWGLIALDSMHYQIPENSFYSRQDIINEILSRQLDDGGFALAGNMCDIDITASVVTALAPYYDSDEIVRRSVDTALDAISSRQCEQGDFQSGGISNAESTAQVIIALTSMNIDIFSDGRFIKNGYTVFDGLMSYRCENGGFAHKSGSDANDLSSAQSLMALVALFRYNNSQTRFYDFGTYEYIQETNHEASNSLDAHEDIVPDKDTSNTTITTEPVSGVHSQANTSVSSSFPVTSHAITKKSVIQQSSQSQSHLQQTFKSENYVARTAASQNKSGIAGLRILIVLSAAAASAIVCLSLKKQRKIRNNVLFVISVLTVVLLIISFLRIKSANNFYSSENSGEVCGKVTLTIDCISLTDSYNNPDDSLRKYVPTDGYILKSVQYDICQGDTVFDVLLKAVKENELQLSFEGASQNTPGTVYVQSIANLGEFSFGELSGWAYTVNGEQKSSGCDDFEVSDGDIIRWAYTCDLGRDIK